MANPNPSPATRFKPGQTPNPLGKTSAQRKLEVEAGEMAARLRHMMLSRMMETVETNNAALDFITADHLRLLKDSEDRAHGTPKQSIDNTSSDGTMSPTRIELIAVPVKRNANSAD